MKRGHNLKALWADPEWRARQVERLREGHRESRRVYNLPAAVTDTMPFAAHRDCTHLFVAGSPCPAAGDGPPARSVPTQSRRINLATIPSSMEQQAAAWAAKARGGDNHHVGGSTL